MNAEQSTEIQTDNQIDGQQGEKTNKSKFTNGEIIKLIRVRFPGNAKSHPFLAGKSSFAYGQKVMAMSDRGMSVGYINSFPYETKFNENMLPLRPIAHEATQDDLDEQAAFYKKEQEAGQLCRSYIDRYKLDMTLTHVEFIQYGKKAVFYFIAPERVDFRQLVKDLVAELKMRIELRQISVRDRTAAIGAIGACGLQTCCSTFLRKYGQVNIKMAKNQNLALVPSKVNGVCGQTKCCIKYEDQVYTDKRKKLPKENSFISTLNGHHGKVLKVHVLIEQFEMLTDQGVKRRYSWNMYDPKKSKPANSWSFPKRFDHITDETSELIQAPEANRDDKA